MKQTRLPMMMRVSKPPDGTTMRRALARVDDNALDAAIGGWLLQVQPPAAVPVVGFRDTATI